MSRTHLNDVLIRALPIPDKAVVQYPDAKVPGFGIRVAKSGTKSFYLRYEFNGQERRLNLGRYPDVKLAQARAKAEKAKVLLRDGIDPDPEASVTDTDSATPTHASDGPAQPPPNNPDNLLFSEALQKYIDEYCKAHNRESTQKEKIRVLRRDFEKPWAGRRIRDIRKADVRAITQNLVDTGRPSAANHANQHITSLFTWLCRNDYLDNSPCAGLYEPASILPRDRVLAKSEIRAVWKAAEHEGFPMGTITQIALLTAQRRGEIAKMKWADLDFCSRRWLVPSRSTKNKKPHLVHLSTLAITLLKGVHRFTMLARQQATNSSDEFYAADLYPYLTPKPSPFVFPSQKDPAKAYSNFSKAKARIAKRAKVEDWGLHDLRRTAATLMGDIGVDKAIKKKILNHNAVADVTDIYDLHEYNPQRREALEAWALMVERIVSQADEYSRAIDPSQPMLL